MKIVESDENEGKTFWNKLGGLHNNHHKNTLKVRENWKMNINT
jgi:hypothetical protein